MIRRPPRSTRTDTPFPYTTLFRSFARCLGGLDRSGGVEGDAAVLQQPLEPAAADGKPALQALGREAAAVLGGDEGAQLSGLQGFAIDDALGLRPFRPRGAGAEVGVERVRGTAARHSEVGEVGGDGRSDR